MSTTTMILSAARDAGMITRRMVSVNAVSTSFDLINEIGWLQNSVIDTRVNVLLVEWFKNNNFWFICPVHSLRI